MTKLTRIVGGCVVLLAACTPFQQDPGLLVPPDKPDMTETIRDRPEKREVLRPAKRITVPVSAPWLSDTIAVRYVDLAAPKALAQVIPEGLLNISFDAPEFPVSSPRDGLPRTRQEYIQNICDAADWYWEIQNGIVHVSDVETRTWEIAALPGGMSAGVSTGAITAGGGGVTISTRTNTHNDLFATLRTFASAPPRLNRTTLTDTPSDPERRYTQTYALPAAPPPQLLMLPDVGQIIATAPPSVIRAMDAIISAHREMASRRVFIEFVLYEVNVNNRNDRKLDLTAMRDAGIDFGLSVTMPRTNAGQEGNSLTIEETGEGHKAKDSEAVFEWLQSQGDTTVVVRKNVVLIHNQPVILNDLETRRYVSEISIQQQVAGATGTISPTVTIDNVDTGETWSALASIVGEDIILRLASGRSRLLSLEAYAAGSVSGRLPRTATTTVETPIILRDGETRVITDLSGQSNINSTSRSPLIDWFAPWGRGVSNDAQRRETVITITATVL